MEIVGWVSITLLCALALTFIVLELGPIIHSEIISWDIKKQKSIESRENKANFKKEMRELKYKSKKLKFMRNKILTSLDMLDSYKEEFNSLNVDPISLEELDNIADNYDNNKEDKEQFKEEVVEELESNSSEILIEEQTSNIVESDFENEDKYMEEEVESTIDETTNIEETEPEQLEINSLLTASQNGKTIEINDDKITHNTKNTAKKSRVRKS